MITLTFFNAAEGQQNIRVVTLRQWLDWAAGHRPDEWQVSLPMIQRGFVWKPAQILELWDTLLRGLPIGALLISELSKDVRNIPLTKQTSMNAGLGGSLGLVDGQQRTLAMLAGWPLPAGTAISHRLWVDFADKPHGSERLRLRVTTRNQPFGFARDSPNTKLAVAERRKALATWLTAHPDSDLAQSQQLPDFQETHPWSSQASLPLDLRMLVQWWQRLLGDAEGWKQKVREQLQAHKISSTDPTAVLASLDAEQQDLVEQRINELASGLERIHAAQIPLIRLDDQLFAAEVNDTTEPPLALLFKRIGSNATPLSDHDYVYAILKHLRPEVHEMVTRLHGHRLGGNGQACVASLMSPTVLTMSALRLAAAAWMPSEKEKRTDPVNPSKEQFHRLIKREGFLDSLLPLLTEANMQKWFGQILQYLEYRDGLDPGLPRHALPCLSRQLVQVLLRLAQVGYLEAQGTSQDEARRHEVLRLALYWWLCVHDHDKASLVAYRVIAQHSAIKDDIGREIMQAILQDSAGYALCSPIILSQRYGLTDTPATLSPSKARGESRFSPTDDAGDRLLCEFWRRWHAPWTHRHPILLWLQRGYVAKLPGDPIAKREEDTPYDYDHILPANHWSGWTGVKSGARFIDYCEHAGIIGNSIGNIRIWGSSDNRSDGAASPAQKLLLVPQNSNEAPEALIERQATSTTLMEASAIDTQHQSLWVRCLPPAGKDNRFWNLERAKAFERAVEQRAFALYERFYEEPNFIAWYEVKAEEVTIASPEHFSLCEENFSQ